MKKVGIIFIYFIYQITIFSGLGFALKYFINQISPGMGSIFGSHLLYFGIIIFVVIPLVFKKLLKIFFSMFIFPFNILFFNKNSNKGQIFSEKIKKLRIWNVKDLWDLYSFYNKIFKNSQKEITDKEKIFYFASKKFFKKIQDINTLLQNHIFKGSYVSNFEEIEKNYFRIKITKETETNENLKKKILANKQAFLEIFEKNNFAPDFIFDTNSENFYINIFDKNLLWYTKTFDENIFKNIGKGEILLGFFPQNKGKIEIKYLQIPISKLFHAFAVGSTRSGKDILINNFIFSILQNIKNFSNSELHFFDTKKSDGMYLENLKKFGIFRYDDYEKYGEILEKFVKEMQEIQAKIGMYSNIENYNKAFPENPLKYKFLIINEFMSLGAKLKGKELRNFVDNLVSLTAEGASAGFKCIFISQSLRSDSVDDFGKILANIKTKFVLKLNSLTEANIIGRGLSETDLDRVRSIGEYRALYIEDNEIKQEFKAFLIEQEDLKKWITENFEIKNSGKFSDKIADYYEFAKNNEGISFKESTEKFNFSKSDWNKFVKTLEENNEIQRLPNNYIVWKKEK